MLPPVTRRSGAPAQRAPVSALISRLIAANGCIPHARAPPALSARRQLRQALALAAEEGSEAEPVVQLRQRGQVGRAAPEPAGCDVEAQIAGNARQLPREKHRVAMRTQAPTEA